MSIAGMRSLFLACALTPLAGCGGPSSFARAARAVVKGKRWLLLSRWVNLTAQKKRQLNALFPTPQSIKPPPAAA